jgi:hypothetical protein
VTTMLSGMSWVQHVIVTARCSVTSDGLTAFDPHLPLVDCPTHGRALPTICDVSHICCCTGPLADPFTGQGYAP